MSRSIGIATLIALVLPLPASSSANSGRVAEIQSLDQVQQGELLQVVEHEVTFRSGNTLHRLPLKDLLHLRIAAESPEPSAGPTGRLELTDDSRLAHQEWQVAGEVLLLASQPGATPASIQVPIRAIRSWRLPRASTDENLAHWNQLLEQKLSTDLLVVVRRSTGTLAPVEGIIESIDSEAVRFVVEGDDSAVDVPWSRVFGLVRFTPPAPRQSAGGHPKVLLTGKSELIAASIALEGDRLRLATPAGATLEIPRSQLAEIDCSAGKVFHLGDLPVVRSTWEPTHPVPEGLDYRPRFDQSFTGDPLRLRVPDHRAAGVWREQTFGRGVALRSGSTLEIDLPAGVRWLTGSIGIDPVTYAAGTAILDASLDGEPLFSLEVDGLAAPRKIEVPLPSGSRSVRHLRLHVAPGKNAETGDNLHFVNARVTR